ncbi:MAG: hypothetical protein WCA85_25695 [Paraburkholderia sp.]|uniref:LysM peptidoglycan-binding domain-containing protein n=1 Tax=Paraburkholderia sp. TaxID=1926495 RepID=UPI003C3B63D7
MNTFATLTLDTPAETFIFTNVAVPERIVFGGKQLLDVQKMIGGRRRVNAMGPDDDPISWTGWLVPTGSGSTPMQRAQVLDSFRRIGTVCTLSWDTLRYQVVISDFHATYEKPFKIPYSISFEVVEDQTQLITSLPAYNPAQAMSTDMASMSTLSNCIGDSTLNGLVGDLQGAMGTLSGAAQPIANGLKAVTSFVSGVANCAAQVVNSVESAAASVVAPLAAVASHVQSLITGAEQAMASGSGVLPGLPASTTVFSALTRMNAAVQLPELYQLRSITARMQVNLPLISTPTSSKTITVGGGDLYTIASQQYGDATRWTDIAAANNISDPVLVGINTLTIPP